MELGLELVLRYGHGKFRVRVRIRVWVRVVNMFGVMVRVNTTHVAVRSAVAV